jgi:anti-anti-sigma factor
MHVRSLVAEFNRIPLGDGLVGIEVIGEFDLADLPSVEDLIDGSADGSSGGLLVDLSRCGFIDSSGIRTLLETDRNARAAGGRVAIASLGPAVRRVFELTGLVDQLSVFDDRDAALRWLADPRLST